MKSKPVRRSLLIVLFVLFLIYCPGCNAELAKQSAPPAAEPLPSESLPQKTSVSASSPSAQGYYIVRKNGFAGVVDGAGQIILPFEYSEINILRDEPALFFAIKATLHTKGEQNQYDSAFYDSNGTCLCEGGYNAAYAINDDYIEVHSGNSCGIVNNDCREIIPCKYDYIGTCAGDIVVSESAPGYEQSNISVFDKNGKLLRSKYIDFYCTAENALLTSGDYGTKYGLMDINFNEIIPAVWDNISPLRNGRYVIGTGTEYGLIDSKGNEILPVKFNYIEENYNKDYTDILSYSAFLPDEAYIYSPDGSVLFHSKDYKSVTAFDGKIIAEDASGKIHALTADGSDIVPPAGSISWLADMQLYACYTDGEGSSYYTADGKLIFQGDASCITPDRFIIGTKNGDINLSGLCDAGGRELAPIEYNYMYKFMLMDKTLIGFEKTDEFGITRAGVMDLDGNILLSGFTSLNDSGYSLFYARKGDVSGLVDINGNWIWHASDYEGLMD